MRSVIKNQAIIEDRWQHLADDAELPDDPEFRAALVAYLEWATRLALHNSQPGADVVDPARGLLEGEELLA